MRLLVDLKPIVPALGLAIEEVLLETARQDGCESIRIWINERAAIVGRSQSIAAEVDVAQAEALGIAVLRRISGGGTVYHYPGNLNVSTFLWKRHELPDVSSVFRFHGCVLANALSQLAPRIRSENNGLYVDGLKVGGASQAHRGNAILFHTTLLVKPSLVPMEKLLLAMRPGYCSKGIASRPQATTSLSADLDRVVELDEVVAPIIDALASSLGVSLTPGRLTEQETERATELEREKYGSLKWNQRL